MDQLFLSYAREDRECAELIARAFADRGWAVWWDRQIKAGTAFADVIQKELESSRCVIVLWSRHSVASQWVRNEANEAMQRGALVPVRIEDVRPTIEFRHLQMVDLFNWRDGFDSPEFEECLAALMNLANQTMQMALPTRTGTAEPKPEPRRPAAVEKPAGDEFWISQDGAQFRAPDKDTLRQWAAEGRVRPDSYVYHRLFERWIPAREVPSLQGTYSTAGTSRTTMTVPVINEPYLIQQGGEQRTIGDLQTLCLWAMEGRVQPGSRVYDPRRKRWGYAEEIPEFLNAHRRYRQEHAWANTPARRFLVALGIGAGILLVAALSIAMFKNSRSTAVPPPTTTTAAAVQPVSVSIENRCTNKTIKVAVAYLDRSNTWITSGWYTVRPKQTKANVVAAMGPDLYFYGVSGKTTWEGASNDRLTRRVPVDRNKDFNAAFGKLQGKTVREVPFFWKRIPAGQTAYTQLLTCE